MDYSKVAQWIAGDPDTLTRDEITALVAAAKNDQGAAAELADRFAGNLQFGTAGLRGKMAGGSNRMNRAVVIRAAAGLISYLKALIQDTTTHPVRVVIGNDARHNSRQFALDSAAVITAAGAHTLLLPDPVPTPLLAYAVRHLEADAGVMVTASHNPAQDNGYKVYLGGRAVSPAECGAQIVPPHDAAIAAQIERADPAAEIPRAENGWEDLASDFATEYIQAISTDELPAAPIRIVHTAMHGVGSQIALPAMQLAGFTDVIPVAAQRDPDPDFPTVSFPNPEEPGAIDLALALAKSNNADVVLANDPDADRLAVAVNDPRSGWRMLHGDELGAVLGAAIAARTSAAEASHMVFVNSVVSSRLLSKIAAARGIRHETTLTGFKWMSRVADMVYAYEEAIGYCVRPDLVRDKDGLAAAVQIARLVARLKAENRSLIDLLDDLARQHGLYLTSQLSARFDDLTQIPQTMARLRSQPPQSLAGARVDKIVDLSQGSAALPPTDGILITTKRDDQVIVRPSGTEPKVKCYLEVVTPVTPDATFYELTNLRADAKQRLEQLKSDVDKALFNPD